jgi:hypothetical protein
MKLFLHNHLFDKKGRPFKIINPDKQTILKKLDPSLVSSVLQTLNLEVLKNACNDIGIECKEVEDIHALSTEDIQYFHHILFEIEITKGLLVSQSGDKYQIIGGIPDLVTEYH